MIKVSVIIPAYNVEKYICDCINSVLNQQLDDIEIIVVDDGSKDSTGEILDDISQKHASLKVIHKNNGGVSKARNIGLSVAEGEYVIFIDSDDLMMPGALDCLYDNAVKNNADVAMGDIVVTRLNKTRRYRFFNGPFVTEDRNYIDELVKTVLYKGYCPSPCQGSEKAGFGYGGVWNKLVRKKIIDENEICFDEGVKGIYDDIIFSAETFFNSKKIVYIDKLVYHYYLRDNSVSRKYIDNILDINDSIFQSWEKFLMSTGKKTKYKNAYYANVLRRLVDYLEKYIEFAKNGVNYSVIKDVIEKEPYSLIASNVEKEKLTHYYRLILFALTQRNSFLLVQICKLKQKIFSIKKI